MLKVCTNLLLEKKSELTDDEWMRKLRWIIFAPTALIAFFASPAVAQDVIIWTCHAETSWQMQQPLADYQAGLLPQWSDCEAWRNGQPADGWQWSYGESVTTTTSSSSTVEVTSTVLPTTTSLDSAAGSTSTTEPPATTEGTTTTTSQATPTTQQTPETSAPFQPIPETTVAPSTTATPTTLPPVTSTSSEPPQTTLPATIPVLPSTSLPDASESSTPPTATPSTFFSPEASPENTVLTVELDAPSADASDEEKQAFEESVNIFSGEHDDYVPLGSNITVGQRRTIVAATTILIALPTPTASRRRT